MNPIQKFRKECAVMAGEHAKLLEKSKHADLALPCFALAKQLQKAPQEIASELVMQFYSKLKKSLIVKEVLAIGPYVNFYIDNEKFQSLLLKQITKEKKKYGTGKNKGRVMVEYSAPNSNKPLHIGHLRNQAIGAAISRILKFSGYKIVLANLVNDRGIHICKSMIAYNKWGEGKTPKTEKIKGDHFVGDYYVLFERNKNEELESELREMLVKWEKKDKATRALWKKMNKWWIDGAKQTYKTFGDRFDVWFFESKIYDKAKPIIDSGLKKGVFFKNEQGAVLANLETHGLPNKIFLREDGTSIYSTQDLILTKIKFEKYKLNKAIWVVASEQNLYLKQLFKTLELLGYKWAHGCYHLSYGLVNLPSGRMKSREGTVVDADDLIAETTRLAKEETIKRHSGLKQKEADKRAMQIALAAIKYMLIKVDPSGDILFEPEKAISFEGDTGPYIQYTYARANSVLRKIRKKGKTKQKLDHELEIALIKKLSLFPDVIDRCVKELKPNHLSNYLFDLATKFNEYYQNVRVIGSDKELERAALVQCVAQVLENGLVLLNIPVIRRM